MSKMRVNEVIDLLKEYGVKSVMKRIIVEDTQMKNDDGWN